MRSPFGFGLVVVGSWLLVLMGGWYVLLRYEFTPGDDGGVPEHWPADTLLSLDAKRATLILFAHRNCPCTRTTIEELQHILTNAPGRARVHVVLLAPGEGATDRVAEAIEMQLQALPDTEIRIDAEGVEARRFHIRTSGHIVLYGREGGLLFSGGITEGRGHAGDNAGRRAVLAQLRDEEPERRATLVYGCSLFDEDDEDKSEGK